MEKTSPPVCPKCQFKVFNRRYPKCESCGTLLPDTLIYSAAERDAMQRQEAVNDIADAKRQHKKVSGQSFDSNLFGSAASCTSATGGGSNCD